MSKDKKKKRGKKALKRMVTPAPSLGSAATWSLCGQATAQALDWAAHPSVTLEFEYFGTRYKGTAYPVGEAER